MVTEDYVSFKVAKLLKEKGFDEKTLSYYEDDVICLGDWFEWNRSPLGHISAPTLQMAMKWLREMYDIHVVPLKDFFNGTYTGRIYDVKRENVLDKDDYIALVGYETYEQACEAAIKYSLENLI